MTHTLALIFCIIGLLLVLWLGPLIAFRWQRGQPIDVDYFTMLAIGIIMIAQYFIGKSAL